MIDHFGSFFENGTFGTYKIRSRKTPTRCVQPVSRAPSFPTLIRFRPWTDSDSDSCSTPPPGAIPPPAWSGFWSFCAKRRTRICWCCPRCPSPDSPWTPRRRSCSPRSGSGFPPSRGNARRESSTDRWRRDATGSCSWTGGARAPAPTTSATCFPWVTNPVTTPPVPTSWTGRSRTGPSAPPSATTCASPTTSGKAPNAATWRWCPPAGPVRGSDIGKRSSPPAPSRTRCGSRGRTAWGTNPGCPTPERPWSWIPGEPPCWRRGTRRASTSWRSIGPRFRTRDRAIRSSGTGSED
jgi:hypothetical protein